MRADSGFQFAIGRRVRLRQLRVDGDALLMGCDCLCSGAETPSGERLVFFAVEAISCVKALSVSASTCFSSTSTSSTTPSGGKPAYRSPKDGVQRAVEFVRGADPQLLLVVETLLNWETKRKRHFLLALRRRKARSGRRRRSLVACGAARAAHDDADGVGRGVLHATAHAARRPPRLWHVQSKELELFGTFRTETDRTCDRHERRCHCQR